MNKYPELEKLKQLYFSEEIIFKEVSENNFEQYVCVEITINRKRWNILIDNEYSDFSVKNSLMTLYLVLSALEDYHESTDYLQWCFNNGLNSSNLKLLDYYKSLANSYSEIEAMLGEIDQCITSYDYQLRTGVVKELASYKI